MSKENGSSLPQWWELPSPETLLRCALNSAGARIDRRNNAHLIEDVAQDAIVYVLENRHLPPFKALAWGAGKGLRKELRLAGLRVGKHGKEENRRSDVADDYWVNIAF